jgi:nitrate/nitrite transport system permease protein
MTLITVSLDTIEPAPPALTEPAPSTDSTTRRASRGILSGAAWALVGFGVLALLWGLAAWRVKQLPGPLATFTELRHLLAHPFKGSDGGAKGIGTLLVNSLGRVLGGFILASIIGVPVGLLIGGSKRAWQAANPVIQLLRPVSPLAWFPIWLIVFKDAAKASLWVIFITALWPILINTAAGVAGIPRDQRNVAKVFRFGRLSYVRHVVLPNALPSIVTGMRLSMGVAWMVIVAVEMLSGKAGIGFFVWDSYNAFNFARVLSAALLVGAIGLLLDLAFLRIGKAVALEEPHA